jgi:hypothetical protein
MADLKVRSYRQTLQHRADLKVRSYRRTSDPPVEQTFRPALALQ